MKLIDYFTKNQLGAGYVRTLRAKEGRTAANSKRRVSGGKEGGNREKRRKGETDLLHIMKVKCEESNRVPGGFFLDTVVFFFS